MAGDIAPGLQVEEVESAGIIEWDEIARPGVPGLVEELRIVGLAGHTCLRFLAVA